MTYWPRYPTGRNPWPQEHFYSPLRELKTGSGEEWDKKILAERWIKKNTAEIAARAKAEAMA